MKCQVQSHRTGANARATRMLPFSEGVGGGKLPSVYPLRVERRHVWTTPRGKGFSCLSCTIFPPRCCLGTPEEWVEDAIILNKPNAVIKQNLEALNYQHISMLQMGKQHFVYHSRGIGKKNLFLPLIKRIL